MRRVGGGAGAGILPPPGGSRRPGPGRGPAPRAVRHPQGREPRRHRPRPGRDRRPGAGPRAGLTAAVWTTLLVIFGAQVVYVSLNTLRWMILMRGFRQAAAGLSVFEIIVWVYALGLVVQNLDDPVKILVYALGYAAGSLTGSWIEGRLALGMATVQVITHRGSDLAARLREYSFGVTTWDARGRDAERTVMLVMARRRRLRELIRLIDELEPEAVVLDLEPRSIRRGFMARRLGG
ncbi:MAG: hypothetical protein DIU84_01630 [Bacillota bacterium]|nr:MAG: hypothetical protein DIU84_01630 [Bacillota bacterium]